MSENDTSHFKVQANGADKTGPLITLGEKFKEMDYPVQVKHLHELASSLNHALDLMQKERNELADQVVTLNKQIEGLDKALEINKEIMRTTITEDNDIKNKYIEEIQALRYRIKTQDEVIEELNRRGDNDRLGD